MHTQSMIDLVPYGSPFAVLDQPFRREITILLCFTLWFRIDMRTILHKSLRVAGARQGKLCTESICTARLPKQV